MVDENNRGVLQQILELADTACQASLELLEQYSAGDLDMALKMLSDLRVAVRTVSIAQEPLVPQLEHAYTCEMLENIEDTLNDIDRSIQEGGPERAAMKMEFQLFPFLRQLRESFYFWGMIYPDQDKMERYYREEFAAHYQNLYIEEGSPVRCKLSIVVSAYNHLETTKRCIEQLLKETDFDALNAELILIDHGSSDGTLDFFEGLDIGKVIRFKKNIRMYVFTTLFQLCQGEYFAFVSNDILVTRNWADILLHCIESDQNISAVVPATPNIANLQMLQVPTNDPDEFIAWANQRNRPNPSLWDDRARLMPPLGMYRTKVVNQFGFADPYFYSMEFWDDDFSFRARRAGYRQMICGDVACYHFGSVTGKDAQKKEGTLVYGRALFEKKNGIDAWGNGFCYDYPAIQLFKQSVHSQGAVTFLGLDCGMGDTPLQIRNELRRQGQECKLYQLTCQKEYLPDLLPHSDAAQYVPSLTKGLPSFDMQAFTCAYLSRDVGVYEDFPQLLEVVSQKLRPDGTLVFFCENPYFAITLHTLLQFQLPSGSGKKNLTDPSYIKSMAEKYFSQVQMVPIETAITGVEEFAMHHFGKSSQLAEITKRLKIEKYYLVCRK